jgi:hypothetical protein
MTFARLFRTGQQFDATRHGMGRSAKGVCRSHYGPRCCVLPSVLRCTNRKGSVHRPSLAVASLRVELPAPYERIGPTNATTSP